MIVVLAALGLLVLALAAVGLRAMDNAVRLLNAVMKRLGSMPARMPRSRWKVPAFFMQALLAPVMGALILILPSYRRLNIASIADGIAGTLVRRGGLCEYHREVIRMELASWATHYGESDA